MTDRSISKNLAHSGEVFLFSYLFVCSFYTVVIGLFCGCYRGFSAQVLA
jgi:hypothetical protein